MKKGIIFDMDGTVWDSSENVAKSWTVKIHEAGYTDWIITRDVIKNVLGKTMDVIADILFSFTEKGPDLDAIRKCFLDHYGLAYGREDDLIEDMECYGYNLLQKDENIRLLAMRNCLDDACYVGDIQSDYDATVKAGYSFIHAAYGFGTVDEDVPYIESFVDLIRVVPEILR